MSPSRFVAGSVVFFLSCAVAMSTLACGAAEAPRPEAPAPRAAVAEAPPKCPASAPNAPDGATGKLDAMRVDVVNCFGLGTMKPTNGVVAVELMVSDSGMVRTARVTEAAGADPSSVKCAEKALRGTKFGSFCGEDVQMRWKYVIQ